jgi:hypothetical protein
MRITVSFRTYDERISGNLFHPNGDTCFYFAVVSCASQFLHALFTDAATHLTQASWRNRNYNLGGTAD